MKIEDATKVKEKLDDILLAVDEYGKQSEQFSKARNDLFSVLGVMNNTNSSLGQLLTACDQYLKKASEVIDGEYFVKIQDVINEINATATNLEKCNENTSTESVKLIEESKKQLAALADTLSQNIQSSIDKVRGTADDLQVYSKQASDNAKQLIESSSNEMLALVEKLKTTCDSLMKESEQLKENDSKIIDTQGKIATDVSKAKDFIADKLQKNNELCENILLELENVESNSSNNKTEIINTINETIKISTQELKSYEESCFNSIKEKLEIISSKQNKTTKDVLLWGGIIATIIIVLQVLNIFI